MGAFRGVASVPRNAVAQVKVGKRFDVRSAEQLAQLVRAFPRAQWVDIQFTVTRVEDLAPLMALRSCAP